MNATGRRIARFVGASLILACIGAGIAVADWREETDDKMPKLYRRSVNSVAVFEKRMPRLQKYFDSAYGYAILPSITRIGVGLGGAWGQGLVVAGDEVVGRTRFGQFTSGIQGGVRVFRQIIFFKDEEAFEYFKSSKLQFMGQASVTFAVWGASADPAYNQGVAIFAISKGGLMLEATVAGGKYTYVPWERIGPDGKKIKKKKEKEAG